MLPTLAITAGEPAGIGPELIARIALRHRERPFAARLVVIGDRDVLAARAARIGLAPRYVDYVPASTDRGPPGNDAIEIWHQPTTVPVTPGQLEPANAHSVLATLQRACDACATGAFAALVTAPVQKSVLMEAGIPFVGHTEFFAQRTHSPHVVMLLVGGTPDAPLRVALVTTHLPLRDVPAAITRQNVDATLALVATELPAKFGLASPRIAVCGLNPHAGEAGHLGREEIDVIAPAIAALRATGHDVTGPLPADTVFVPGIARRFDVIVAMYTIKACPCSRPRASAAAST
jgi:4-hydroxythreonine-4-phosphate dehydrogenase